MCGITGYWNLRSGEPIDRQRLKRMNDVMIPRGPDDEGEFVDGSFGMAARRLSIIDLAGGHQPIGSEDGRFWIVYNGEVYNFPELRLDLLARGHVFRTRTDTETIVHLFEDLGPETPSRLNGMFAFAIFDRVNRSLFLVRDRLGIKPLFYSYRNGQFVFGSDMKSFLELGGDLCDEIDREALHHYLSLNYIPGPRTIFSAVRCLQPGHWLKLDAGGRLEVTPYWQLSYAEENGRRTPDLVDELRSLLADSVRKRLIADVPVGVLLSGGLDSSCVATYMAQASRGPIQTFSVRFAEDSFSEIGFARQMAKRLGTVHHEVEVGPPDEEFIRDLVWDLGQPYADSSMIPLHHVCKLARQHVKVVLSGDGGDEVFAGYQTYTAYRLAGLYRRLPSIVTDGLIRPLVERLPVSDRKISFEYRAKRFVRAASLPPEVAHFEYKVLFTEAEKERLYRARNGHRLAESYSVFDEIYPEANGTDVLNKLLYADTKVYLPDDILAKVDRMSMAHSLEARVPLLDYRIVEFAAKLPTRLKQGTRGGKVLLRKAMRGVLPPAILRRKKAGFNVPASVWLKGPLREMVEDYLSPSGVSAAGQFEPGAVRSIVEAHVRGEEDRSREIFGLLVYHIWYRHLYKDLKVRA